MTARRLLVVLSVLVLAVSPQPATAQSSARASAICDGAVAAEAGCAPIPAPASTPHDIISIWGGARETIALRADGTVFTWGLNGCDPNHFTTGLCGKLGDGTTTDRSLPIEVHGPGNVGNLDSVTAIMGGEHDNLALRTDGTLWAWGANFVGQLGTGNYTDTETPVQVTSLISVTKLGGRGYHSLAVDANGTVWAWGWNKSGELGHDTTGLACPAPLFGTCSNVPVQVVGLTNPLTVTGGGFFSLALMPDHTVMGWGANNYGELGDASYTQRAAPVHASAVLSHVVNISAGWTHAVALTDDGHVWTWGDNSKGEIGNGVTSTTGISVPYEVPGLQNVVGVSGGDSWTGALLADGTVVTWGYNMFGQLGDGNFNDRSTPGVVPGLTNVKLFAARDYHGIAVKQDGTVWDWGSGMHGELGHNAVNNSAVPVQVQFSAPPLWWLWEPLVVR
jgi:alpha-tubulin suppressor-like RCC1 family protein